MNPIIFYIRVSMFRILGYFVANVAVLLLFNYFPNTTIELVPAMAFVVFLTLLNWTIVPLIKLLALPINFLSFGLINGIINIVVLLLMINVIKGFNVGGGVEQQLLFVILISIGFEIGHAIVNKLTDEE